MVDGTGLENRRGETHREFESRPLRIKSSVAPRPIYYVRLALCGLLKKSRDSSESQKYPRECKTTEKTLKVFALGSKLSLVWRVVHRSHFEHRFGQS